MQTHATARDTASPEIELALLLSTPELTPDERSALRERITGVLDWNQVLGILFAHRTVGTAWLNLSGLGVDALEALRPYYVVPSLQINYEAQRMYGIDQTRGTARLMRAFDEAGIRCAMMKGAAVAAMAYPDPSVRLYVDNDLLFHREDLRAVGEVLRDLGYRQGVWDPVERVVQPASRSEILLHAVHSHETFPYVGLIGEPLIHGAHEVDVHFSIDLLTSNNSDDAVAELLSRRIQVEGASGDPLWTLDHDDMFLFVCVHFQREAVHLSEVETTKDLVLYKAIDLLGMISGAGSRMDLATVVERARALGLTREVYFSAHYVDVLFPNRVPAAFLEELRPDSVEYLDEVWDNDGPVHRWRQGMFERFFDMRRFGELEDR
ncbi:putative nucleotidyltransferase-like protein [Lentzea atacamensis]|uniref:Nucleotidyltransferase-like protein n=1 Tax=Lentzea atacamensis TaxID=531938 RepID=A0ABX9DXU5_9PSEU|nr:nucleotidyltransferase family protein [Lentzea atacamensis]RAS59252.1 putative nucleotidyltransferase-like protein [Lentzea atacamensis]